MEPPSTLNMSAYTQFGYPYPSPASQLLVSQSGGGAAGANIGNATTGGCCEGGRTIMTDPATGQPICSCQYDRLALGSYSRLGSGLGASGAVYSSTYPSSEQSPYPSIGVDSSAFYSPLSGAYSVKEGATADMSMYGSSLGASPAGYYPYDHAFYGYGAGYDLASRRKNATRESTATLKAWLNEHKKNPYPTKGEKIMLAIITKMTLTQVSTWFANARRRLKKENKMTWEPRNKTDDDDAKLSDDDDDEKDSGDKDDDDIKKDDKDGDATMTETKVEEGQTELKSCDGGAPTKGITAALSPAPTHHTLFPPAKGEKIWSLADTAACKTPPPPPQPSSDNNGNGANVWLAGGTTFPLPPTIPPSITSSQAHQYSRFSHLMPGAIPSQYMANSYSEGVGTDTPPQTPPNAKGTINQNGVNQINLLGNPGAYMGVNPGGPGGVYGLGGPLSSCSSRSSHPSLSHGAPMGAPPSDVPMNPAAQRYPGSGVPGPQTPHTNPNGSMVSTAFTPIYKTSQLPQQASQQQQVTPSSQQPQQSQQQQAPQQNNNVLTSSSGSLVPSSYVT